MKNLITKTLDQIEAQENVRILHCVESGSRAWGFSSADSDYDVRFIYVRPKEFYLRLDQTRDVIELQNETLDISGWDVQKALVLLHGSNPAFFEWNASPIVYRTTDEWQSLLPIFDKYFSVKSGIYHYLSMAKRHNLEYLKGENVKPKKYFYVLRAILACKHILQKATPPPIEFGVLADEYLDASVKPDVEKLLYLKTCSPEIRECPKNERLNDYIIKNIDDLEQAAKNLKGDERNDWDELNKIFLSIIEQDVAR